MKVDSDGGKKLEEVFGEAHLLIGDDQLFGLDVVHEPLEGSPAELDAFQHIEARLQILHSGQESQHVSG
jgi:hypothetical protein